MRIHTLSASTKPWYRRPRATTRPADFPTLLATTVATLHSAAAHAPCVLASSLSAEDMVLFHLVQRENLSISTFALDTGRLPKATLELWATAEAHYGATIERVTPTTARLAELEAAQSESAIYEAKSARELCCTVRKTEPLRAALAGKRAWLADWDDDALWYFIDLEQVPVSSLYDKGYASIGCDPCTRPIRFDEHPRAGRWWWEAAVSGTATECGIHVAHKPSDAKAHQTTGVAA